MAQIADLESEIKETEIHDRRFLYSEKGKELLSRAVQLNLHWPYLVKIFRRSYRTLNSAFSFHRIDAPKEEITLKPVSEADWRYRRLYI